MPTGVVTSQAMEFVAQAQEALSLGKIEEAQKHMHEALTLAPRDADVLTAFGGMLADIGNTEKALLTLQQAVRISPDAGFEKYMYLGQILGATDEADELLCKGIDILKQEVEAVASSDEQLATEEAAVLASTLSSALCSLAELRMSNADDLEDVADSCTELLEQAAAICPESPEPLQALASVKYEQGNVDAALEILRESISKWWHPDVQILDDLEFADDEAPVVEDRSGAKASKEQEEEDAAEGGIHVHGNHQEGDAAPDGVQPSFEFRVECCKLLLELDTTTDTALQILDVLLCENDEAPHVWHLLALAHYAGASFDEASEALQRGQALLDKVSDGTADDETVELFHELRERIDEGKSLAKNGQAVADQS